MIPFLSRLNAARSVIFVGCGGGFDIFAGVPLILQCVARGQKVTLANLSFTRLEASGARRIDAITWRIDNGSVDLPFFPERWLTEWLLRRGVQIPLFALARSGVAPLSNALAGMVEQSSADLLVLIDGGTDSVVFGDEPGLGTPTEDMATIIAACHGTATDVLLAALGFGIDHFHGVSHHAFLENVATLTRDGGYLGSFSIGPNTPEADALLELTEYANSRQPQHHSIVMNSIASALRGEFGDYPSTDRTAGSELFISPLMTQYWTFDARRIRARMLFANDLLGTSSAEEVERKIEQLRSDHNLRPRRPIPL